MLEAALDYARQGFRVHPLRPGTKVPMVPAWQTAATTDPEAIATWWGEHPTANIGIATGEASDLWVLDIDTGHGPDAAKSLAALVEAHGELAATVEVITPSGGKHLWYRWPKADGGTWRNTNALGRGIDVRAEGGQVAAYPSVLADGTKYRKPSRGKRVRVPRWLADKAQHRDAAGTGVRVRVEDLDPGTASAAQQYGARAIQEAVRSLEALGAAAVKDWAAEREQYRGPSWDDATFAAACRLLRLAHADWTTLTTTDAEALVRQYAPSDSGFGEADHERVLRSARQSVGDDEAPLPTYLVNPLPILEVPAGGDARPPAMDPAGFFDKTGLRVIDLARAIDEGDLAVGPDASLWRYVEGVYRRDDDIVTARGVALLGNRWRSGYTTTLNQRVRLGHALTRLGNEPHEAYLNLRNGMLDWATGELIEHAPGFRSTVQLPLVFDADATCPTFDRWASEVVEPDDVARLLEVVGYMIAPGNPLQKAVLLYGDGGNGKGTLIRLLRTMIGNHNTSAVTLKAMTEGKFETADLVGKQANLAGDIDPRYLKTTAPFKALTGGDVVQAQRKHGQPFDFTCYATPLFSANELWRSADNTAGYLRRWTLLPMMKSVGKAGTLDERELYAEGPGILNRVLPALRLLMARRAFTESIESAAQTDRFAEQADLVRTWLAEDDAIIDATPGADPLGSSWRKRDEVFARFHQWSADNGHGEMSSTRFYERLRHLGYGMDRRRAGRGIIGIVLDSTPGGLRSLSVSLLPHDGSQP